MRLKFISTQNRGGPVLSKVAGYQQKSLPTRLVSASYSAWHFFTDGAFKIKYPWTGCLLWKLSCILQNFLTSLGALYLGGRAYHFFFVYSLVDLYLGKPTSRGGGGLISRSLPCGQWSLGSCPSQLPYWLMTFAPFSYHHSVMYSTQSFDTDNFDVTYPCSMPLKDLCKWPNYPQSSMWSLITSAVLWKTLGFGQD